jgi:hypothetical protein
MPGGGRLVSAGPVLWNHHINNLGEVCFDGLLDTDDNGDGSVTGLSTPGNGPYAAGVCGWRVDAVHLGDVVDFRPVSTT